MIEQKLASVVDEIIHRFELRGGRDYTLDRVTQTEHAIQTALLAEDEGAPNSLIAAALLHDFGHLLQRTPRDLADLGVDDRHELVGSRWLARHFGQEVTEPIRLHVPAKRYLCGADPGYLDSLSPASIRSLALQGGPMNPGDRLQFESEPYHHDAVWLRRLDDRAKVKGSSIPELDAYRGCLAAAFRR